MSDNPAKNETAGAAEEGNFFGPPPAAPDRDKPNPFSGFGGLIAIIVAIVIGALLGFFYGEQMWIAGGGVADRVEVLERAKSQKEEFAAKAEKQADELAAKEEKSEKEVAQIKRLRAEAPHLRSAIPKIDTEIARLNRLQAEAVDSTSATFFWELTGFCGDLFLQVLKLLVIPLVVTSMIVGITSLGDIRKIGRIGAWTLIYYLITACVAVLMGIVLVQVIQPGRNVDDTFAYVSDNVMEKENTTPAETLLNVFRGRPDDKGSGMFPSNIFLAATKTNVLALIVFALVFGAVLTTLGKDGNIVIQFFRGANEAVMKMVHLVMFFAPVGIFGLVAHNIAKKGGGNAFYEELSRLSKYVGTVSLGLTLHFVLLTIVLALLARRNPFKYIFGVARALLTAVTTASSSATLPISLECVEENNGVSNRAASFVLPLGATINMDGTALYEAVAVIFIAQSLGIDLTMGHLLIIFVTATLAAIGAAGIPEAGLVTMVIVLAAVDLPITGIGTILAIDWFLDRLRTTVNVYGDTVGAGIIDARVVAQT